MKKDMQKCKKSYNSEASNVWFILLTNVRS